MTYALLPPHMEYLENAGNRWSYSNTGAWCKCFNRVIGDIHFSPAEMEGFVYWVCCYDPSAESGRSWVPCELGSSHPLTHGLALEHRNSDTVPEWALRLNM